MEELSARFAALEKENVRLREENQQLREENQLLRQKLDRLIRHYFGGRRNEAIDEKQLELLLQGLPVRVEVPKPAPKSKPTSAKRQGQEHPVRRALADGELDTEEVVLEPQEVQDNPEGWRQISEERSEQLDWVAPRIIRRVFIRPRYVRAEKFALAPLPPQPIDKGMVGPGLLAQILINKYEYHLPLYRQAKMFKEQHRVELNRKTMGGWVEQVATLLQPVYRVMKEELVRGDYLQADETPIRYLDPDLKGKSRKGFLWVYGRPTGDVIFEWQTNRSRAGPQEFLKTFRGKLQVDGYGAYESLCKSREGLELVGCWAHTRRAFHLGLEKERLAAWFVGQIGQLYAVESKLRQQKAGPRLREALRAAQSAPVLVRLRKAMIKIREKVLPQSLVGQAISYALARWESLTRYVEDGRLEIDTNILENSIRPSALGKRNWLFIGHPEAGWRSAVIYSLLGSCRRHGVNPYEYLKDLLTRLPAAKNTQVPQFTPSAWAQAQRKQPCHKAA
jgi:transposase